MFLLLQNSATAIWLNPEYNFKADLRKEESVHRTPDGSMYRYKWGEYDRWKFGLRWVSENDKYQLNTWYTNNTALLFSVDSGITVNSVYIVNKELPIGEYEKPYMDQYKGTLELETY